MTMKEGDTSRPAMESDTSVTVMEGKGSVTVGDWVRVSTS